jgi:hypothetical protein
MADYTKLLDRLYNDPESPAGFAGVDQLWAEARKKLKHIPRDAIVKYLEGHRTYTIHRPRRLHFLRSRTVPAGYLTDFQADLADMQWISRFNNGYRYILVGIDVLSKRVFAAPLKSKNAKEMVAGFEHLFKHIEMLPHRVYTDKGKEFTNKDLRAWFDEKDIQKHQPNSSTVKAALAENCIKRLKSRLFRYMSEKHTRKWVDVLDKIVNGINHARSRVLGGLRPVDVSFRNARQVRQQQYGSAGRILMASGRAPPSRTPKFKVGDHVRMSRDKGTFTKGYLPTFHDEILEVNEVQKGGPKSGSGVTRYAVRDHRGEPFKGYFYEQDLAKVTKDDKTSYRIERHIRKGRDKDGKERFLVKFFDDPAPYWIYPEDLV